MPTLAWACDVSGTKQHAHASVGMAPVNFNLANHLAAAENNLR